MSKCLRYHTSICREGWRNILGRSSMPDDPDYLSYQPGVQGANYVYGAEYETHEGSPLRAVREHNVPCAVCYASTKVAIPMIPAKTRCPSNWTLATSCQTIIIISTPCMSVLIRTQTQCQAVLLILMVLCFTMLKLECCAHLMIHRKNLPVQFVLNRGHYFVKKKIRANFVQQKICTCQC